MDPYSNFLSNADPEFLSMQVNYLRMLANYYKSPDSKLPDPKPPSPDPEENILERSLQAESVFLQTEIDIETMPTDHHCKEILSFSPPCKNYEQEEVNQDAPNRSSFISRDSDSKFVGFQDTDESFVKKTPLRRQFSYGNDEQPIKAGGSFEQLLERELKKTSSASFEEPQNFPPRMKVNKFPKANPEEMPLRKTEQRRSLKDFDLPRPKKAGLGGGNKGDEIFTPKTKPSEGSPKAKAKFLKRGEGKLCVEQKAGAKANSANTSKVFYGEKEEGNDLQGFEEEQDEMEQGMYLDEQIKHYNRENLKLQKLVKEVEDKKKRLDRERNEFLKEKEKKIEEFEKWKAEETEKIKKDKQVYEKKLRMQMKERDEVSELKAKLEKLEKEKSLLQEAYEKEIKSLQTKLKSVNNSRYQASESSDKLSEDLESLSKPNQSLNEDSEDLPEKPLDSESSSEESFRPPAGKKEMVYSNGIRKEVYPDGYSVVYFNNKDVKQCFADGRIVYHYAEAKTTQTTFPDGMQLFKFANGQIEKHFPDGSKEISFQDGTVKCVYPDGQEESVFPDGTVQTLDAKGVKYIEFVNGQKDTIYPNGVKIRRFPDGRVKKIMPDGKVIEQ